MRLVVALAVVTAVLLSCTSCSSRVQDQNPIAADVLEGFTVDIKKIIAAAQNSADATLAEAASELQVAVDNMTSSLGNQLSAAIDKLTDAERLALNNMQDLINKVSTGARDVINTATDGAQQIVDTLPGHDKTPQVRSYSPTNITNASCASTVPVVVKGNFEFALNENQTPTLKPQNAPLVTPSTGVNTTNELRFDVPRCNMPALAADSATPVTEQLVLTIPWTKGYVFHSKQAGVFNLQIIVLPIHPIVDGNITFPTDKAATQSVFTEYPANGQDPIKQTSGVGVNTDQTYTVPKPSDGDIDPYSVNFTVLTRTNIESDPTVVSANAAGIVVEAHTPRKCSVLGIALCEDSSITFRVTFNKLENCPPGGCVRGVESDPLSQLKWGDSALSTTRLRDWQAYIKTFDGRELHYAPGTGDPNPSPYFTLRDAGQSVLVSTPAAQDVSPYR